MRNEYLFLIEDNKAISDSLVWAIEYEGYSVIAKSNGQEAIDFLKENDKPSLILLDMILPILNGWKFREYQHSDDQLTHIPTILMSAMNELEKCVKIFPNELLLPKPFNINELIKIIKKIFSPSRV